ncbi:helix-turn-helix domain-containing protein [Tsukamurella spumae]|uniref:Helix-turn-helix transcriptional regulator n=1 Tax=Tsukamurella spumae TaxID=44753 RepID=A0A846X317_9ACTN|nr:helix-turn-helix transcriptional regulator [Tsukamurella spumae]NKY19744.1 helix-turn-helix transcriptional regulator [Tsukamurella spumae]
MLTDDSLGAAIRRRREQLPLSQELFAKRVREQNEIPMAASVLARIEAGTRPARVPELVAIAASLGTTPTVLIAESDDADDPAAPARAAAQQAEQALRASLVAWAQAVGEWMTLAPDAADDAAPRNPEVVEIADSTAAAQVRDLVEQVPNLLTITSR